VIDEDGGVGEDADKGGEDEADTGEDAACDDGVDLGENEEEPTQSAATGPAKMGRPPISSKGPSTPSSDSAFSAPKAPGACNSPWVNPCSHPG
jgi:hypothetical protein